MSAHAAASVLMFACTKREVRPSQRSLYWYVSQGPFPAAPHRRPAAERGVFTRIDEPRPTGCEASPDDVPLRFGMTSMRQALAWILLASMLLSLQPLLSPSQVLIFSADPIATAEPPDDDFPSPWLPCEGRCCALKEPRYTFLSLLVVLPVDVHPSEGAIASWLSIRDLDEIILLRWGACPAAIPDAGAMRIRLVCAPDETAFDAGRAYNLAAHLSNGRVLVVASPRTVLSSATRDALGLATAAAADGARFSDGGAALLVLPRSMWMRLRGWDERLPTNATTEHAGQSAPSSVHASTARADVAMAALGQAHSQLLARAVRRGYERRALPKVSWQGAPGRPVAAGSLGTIASPPSLHSFALLRAWEDSMVTPTLWRLSEPKRAMETRHASAEGRSWCVARASLRPPQPSELLRGATDEHARATWRLHVFALSERSVPWGLLQRMDSVDELRALAAVHALATHPPLPQPHPQPHPLTDGAHAPSHRLAPPFASTAAANAAANAAATAAANAAANAAATAGGVLPDEAPAHESAQNGAGGVLLVHVQNSLPRRLLAMCTAAALAAEWRVPLAVAWPSDAVLSDRYEELFERPPVEGKSSPSHPPFSDELPSPLPLAALTLPWPPSSARRRRAAAARVCDGPRAAGALRAMGAERRRRRASGDRRGLSPRRGAGAPPARRPRRVHSGVRSDRGDPRC